MLIFLHSIQARLCIPLVYALEKKTKTDVCNNSLRRGIQRAREKIFLTCLHIPGVQES